KRAEIDNVGLEIGDAIRRQHGANYLDDGAGRLAVVADITIWLLVGDPDRQLLRLFRGLERGAGRLCRELNPRKEREARAESKTAHEDAASCMLLHIKPPVSVLVENHSPITAPTPNTMSPASTIAWVTVITTLPVIGECNSASAAP